MIINCYQPYWNSGLVVWISTCVHLGTGFNPRQSARPDYSVNFWQQFHIRRNTAILAKFFEKKTLQTRL